MSCAKAVSRLSPPSALPTFDPCANSSPMQIRPHLSAVLGNPSGEKDRGSFWSTLRSCIFACEPAFRRHAAIGRRNRHLQWQMQLAGSVYVAPRLDYSMENRPWHERLSALRRREFVSLGENLAGSGRVSGMAGKTSR